MNNAFYVLISLLLFCLFLSSFRLPGGRVAPRPQSYLLYNQVTHARVLPTQSAHAFTYPTISFLVSLRALESHSLDLAQGWLFGYGGKWGRIFGLRSRPYLTRELLLSNTPRTIRAKLEDLLRARGFLDNETDFDDAWIMTMPNFFGFEGINPLTVYYCYQPNGTFWLTVLEIHNTFGESHVHILETGKNEDLFPSRGYDHQWTFRREFHVSPFNDRSGFYTVSVKSPSHPPMFSNTTPYLPPKPSVRVHLYTESTENSSEKGSLKLRALLRPTRAVPLTGHALLVALVRAPFVLFLSFPRILFVAWKLHYRKRLDVFLRPEPLPAVKGWSAHLTPENNFATSTTLAGGVRWLDEGFLEKFCRHRVEIFLKDRTKTCQVEVVMLSADPSVKPIIFTPTTPPSSRLTIFYLSPRIFKIMFLSPSPQHALLLGSNTVKIFDVSSKELFLFVFTPEGCSASTNHAWLQKLRLKTLPRTLNLSSPTHHYLDGLTLAELIQSTFFIYIANFLEWFEEWFFGVARARIVEGQEPWKQWEIAAEMSSESHSSRSPHFFQKGSLGSVIRE